MANVNAMFESKFLKQDHIKEKSVYIMASCEPEELEDKDGNVQVKPVVRFRDTKMGFPLNVTNAQAIAELYGPETEEWADKPIKLEIRKDRVGNKMVDCIRVALEKPVPEENPF